MASVKIADGFYWVGAVDWNLRYFHGPEFKIHRGTTYNSYLIIDEQVTLVDGVYHPFADDLMNNIREVIDPDRISRVVVNHIEADHSGALPVVMKAAPKAQVFCTQKAMDGLRKQYRADWDFHVVHTGDELNLGKRTLTFIEAPMLHWPDSMFTYIKEDGILMPNDAFGQHYASNFRFDDQVSMDEVMEEAAKYYANILLPFGSLVLRKLDEIGKMGIPLNMICPSHGIIWRKEPDRIAQAYAKWARGEAEAKVLVLYETMWNSTALMAQAILDGITSAGVTAKLYRLSVSDKNDIIKEVINAKAVIVGSSTIHNGLLPSVLPLLDDLKGLKPKNKIGFAFGSFGWGGGAVKSIEEMLRSAGIEIAMEGLAFKWVPDAGELNRCFEAGKAIGEKVK